MTGIDSRVRGNDNGGLRALRSYVSFVFVAIAMLAGCTPDLTAPILRIDPGTLTLTPSDMHTITVRWSGGTGARTTILERRANLEGEFEVVATLQNKTSYVDRDLQPNTMYGYRIRVFNDFDQLAGTSPVAGARTPPEPGILIRAASALGNFPQASIDSTGYVLTITGPGISESVPLEDVNGSHLLSPLPPGAYTVSLGGLEPQCELAGSNTQTVTVTDQGVNTRAAVTFNVVCRARTRGRLRVELEMQGDTTDPNGFRFVVSGIADDNTLPPSEGAVVVPRNVSAVNQVASFVDLLPGVYSVLVDDLSPVCTIDGPAQRDGIVVTALGDLLERITITCNKPGSGGNHPFILRTTWSADAAPVGTRVTAAVILDLRQEPLRDVTAAQFIIRTPSGTNIVRLDSAKLVDPWGGVVNTTQPPGEIRVVATHLAGLRGLVPIVTGHYTVIGTNGQRARTQAEIEIMASGAGTEFQSQVRAAEDTLVVGTAGPPPPPNQTPIANANGPYTGIATQPMSFSSAGSSDPDGNIASFAWAFGDGQSGSGASPTHTYAAAGNYTVTLTVTDNLGATAQSTAAVTVDPSVVIPPTSPFIWKVQFGTFNPLTQTVPLHISLDLTANIPETPGTEQLQDWIVDSLKWNKDVLQFNAFERASGTSTVNFIEALSRGVLRLRGTVDPGQSTGIVPIGTVHFGLSGNPGQSTTVNSHLGTLTGAASTGLYNYTPQTRVENTSFVIPGGGNPTTTTVSGTVSSQQQGMAGVTVSLGSGLAAVTASDGAYTISNVAAGNYTAVLSGLPGTCTTPPAVPVTVGATPVTGVNFSVVCTSAPPPPPPSQYPMTISFSAPSGGQSTMSVRIDMNAINDPANHGSGADLIGAFQATFDFSASRLSNAACTGQSGFTGVFNTGTPGSVTAVITNLSGAGGMVTLLNCTFSVAGTGPTPVTVTGLLASDELGSVDFTNKINVIVIPLP